METASSFPVSYSGGTLQIILGEVLIFNTIIISLIGMVFMNEYKIACFDVYYYENYAKSCCIVFVSSSEEEIICEYCRTVEPINDYVSGEFYKRELPCILSVYNLIKMDIDIIIIDGFVTLNNGKKGLGAYLYDSLNKQTPVIGVAKTLFSGCESYSEVYRGISKKPLYVSSIGIDLEFSANLIKNLKGKNRTPDVLKRIDHLTRLR